MTSILQSVDARTKLAGTNKLEILLFTLGMDSRTHRRETFGINVFKVREVMRVPEITHAPEMPDIVEGMVSLRGELVPVIHLPKYAGVDCEGPGILIIAEYNLRTQGFLVESVDTILRLDWGQVKVPPDMVKANMGGIITSVTELPDRRLVMMLDVEKILSDTIGADENDQMFKTLDIKTTYPDKRVLFVDDSSSARKHVQRTLEALGVQYLSAENGADALRVLQRVAAEAEAADVPVRERLHLVVTDVEMPEMDGYVLTRHIKTDPKFAGIPVLMYSSLSSVNKHLGGAVGVDEYVPKLQPRSLAEAVERHLTRAAKAQPADKG